MSSAPTSIGDLLRSTKLAQVAKSSTKNKLSFTLRGSHYPTNQIIANKNSTLYRDEWGLKSNIPSKGSKNKLLLSNKNNKNSRYLVFNELDTLERMTTFEPIGGSQWNRIRFQEMGLVPSYGIGSKNPFFNFEENLSNGNEKNKNNNDNNMKMYDSQLKMLSQSMNVNSTLHSNTNGNTNKKKVFEKKLNILKRYRNEFREWLLQNDPEILKHKRFNSMELKEKAAIFLNDRLNSNNSNFRTISDLNNSNSKKNNVIIGSGGLSYNLDGRLKNTPMGIPQKVIVPGRIITSNHSNNTSNYDSTMNTRSAFSGYSKNYSNTNNNNNSSSNTSSNMATAAIGGFFAKSTFNHGPKISYGLGSFLRELVLPFEIQNITMEKNGKIHMNASSITTMKKNTTANNNGRNSTNSYSRNLRKSNIDNYSNVRKNTKKDINDLLFALENTGKNM